MCLLAERRRAGLPAGVRIAPAWAPGRIGRRAHGAAMVFSRLGGASVAFALVGVLIIGIEVALLTTLGGPSTADFASDVLFVKTLKCGTETIMPLIAELSEPPLQLELRVLEKPYHLSFQGDARVITAVRDPLLRLQSHYYYSNRHRPSMSFDDWYDEHHSLDPGVLGEAEYSYAIGWGGQFPHPARMRNYLANYLGFEGTELHELTKEKLSDRFSFIFVMERMQESFDLFAQQFGVSKVEAKHANRGAGSARRAAPDARIAALFEANNEKDLRIHALAGELLDDLIAKQRKDPAALRRLTNSSARYPSVPSTKPAPSPSPVRVAVLLTGHARTFEKTSRSIHQNLIRANRQMTFTIFISTYDVRDTETNGLHHHTKFSDTAGHLNVSRTVTEHELASRYAPTETRIKIHTEREMFDLLPSKHIHKPGASFTGTQYKQRRTLGMFRLISEGYKMVQKAAPQNGPFDLLVKLRLDCSLTEPWKLANFHLRLQNKQAIAMPERMQTGNHHYRPDQIKTHPCDKIGGKTPSWVSDHVALGPLSSMRYYASEMTGDGEIDAKGRPELTLAKFLKKNKVQVWCDPSLKYTVERKNM